MRATNRRPSLEVGHARVSRVTLVGTGRRCDARDDHDGEERTDDPQRDACCELPDSGVVPLERE